MKAKLYNLLQVLFKFGKRNLPTILTTAGAVGATVTVVEAVKATPEAIDIINKEKAEVASSMGCDPSEIAIKASRAIKLCWKIYLKAIIIGFLSLGMIFGGNYVSVTRLASAVTALSVTRKDFDEYKKAAEKLLVDKEVENPKLEVQKEISREKYHDSMSKGYSNLEKQYEEDYLMYDGITGTYFYSNLEKCRDAMHKVNEDLIEKKRDPRPLIALRKFYKYLNVKNVNLEAECFEDYTWSLTEGFPTVSVDPDLLPNGEGVALLVWDIPPCQHSMVKVPDFY